MGVFDKLVPLLLDAIPQAVASLKLSKPICILRIYYYDGHAPCMYLSLRSVTDECRNNVLASEGRNAPFYIWASSEECGDWNIDLPPDSPASKSNKQIATLFEDVYDLLGKDEDECMFLFRQMLHQVAKTLNAMDWKKFCKVTDDFVVVPADGSQHFAGDDYTELIESVPAERLELLRSRRILGPGENWSQLA